MMKLRIYFAGLLLITFVFCSQAPVLHFAGIPIILISLDTTRADHLSCYGYNYRTSPNIDAIAKDGIIFKNVISQVPLTLPSHSSLFTGLYPYHLQVKDNGGYFLDNSYSTLAEVLAEHNYATAGVIGAFVLHSKWGISQGFQFYDDNVEYETYKAFSLISIDRPASVVSKKAIGWLNSHAEEKPFFLFVHFFDPHAPYISHKELPVQLPMPYDEEIAFMDVHVGKVMQILKEMNLYDSSIIILFGDHGEGLGEHGEKAHGIFLYDSVLRVPLIVKLPGSFRKGSVVGQQVQLVDIMPTILELAEIKHSLKLDGISLVDYIKSDSGRSAGSRTDSNRSAERFAYSETYHPYLHYGWSPLFSTRTNEFKYIQAPHPEFYDMKKDMHEQHNLISGNSKEADKYGAYLKTVIPSTDTIAKPSALSKEDREKLMALGYAGFSPETVSQASTIDPKDKIDVLQALEEGKEFADKNDLQNAITKLHSVVQKDSGIVEAWFVLGNTYAKLRDFDEAIQAFLQAVKLQPANVYALFNLAHAYQQKGDWKEAVAWYKKAVEVDKTFFKALVSAGELLYFMREYDEALHYLKEAQALRNNVGGIYNYLAGIYYFKGNFAEAKKCALKAYELDPKLPFLHFHLALLFEKENNVAKAMEAYKKELEINPKNYSAMNNLGILYARTKQYREAEKLFRELIEVRQNDWRLYILLANVLQRENGDQKEIDALTKKSRQLQGNQRK